MLTFKIKSAVGKRGYHDIEIKGLKECVPERKQLVEIKSERKSYGLFCRVNAIFHIFFKQGQFIFVKITAASLFIRSERL